CGRDIGDVASRTLTYRLFSCDIVVGQWMMAEGEEAPAIGLGKAFIVFHRHVDAVVLAVEKSASRWFCTRAVWKSRVKHPSQFFYYDRSFGKLPCLQIGINIFLLNVDMMIFGKVRLSVIESIGC